MGCFCCKKKNEDEQYDSGKTQEASFEDNNYGDNDDDEKNDFENTNDIADNNMRKTKGSKEENSFDNENNIEYKEENIFENEEKNTNYILAEINITEENINKDIRIINSFEESKRINKWVPKVDDYKYENENEIKDNCIIKIDDKTIPFNYFYNFKEKGYLN